MSGSEDPVVSLLNRLRLSAETISGAYYHGRIVKTDDNAREIDRLKNDRMLSPDIRDTYQLRSVLRRLIDTTLNKERLFAAGAGANVGGLLHQLDSLVEEHAIAFQEGREADREMREAEVRETIADIADAIDDELNILHAQVSNRFGAVATIGEKKRQNGHYQKRAKNLQDLLEKLHFSLPDIEEQVSGHPDLALTLKILLSDRIQEFRESLHPILETLDHFLFEFRRIEERAKRFRAMAQYLKRNPDWAPKDWDEAADPAVWMTCATPLALRGHPDVDSPENAEFLKNIALIVPRQAAAVGRKYELPGEIDFDSSPEVLPMQEPPIRTAIRRYFKEAKHSTDGISARRWWVRNPSALPGIGEEMWLIRVLAEHDNKGKDGEWALRLVSSPHPGFSGNILIQDAVISRKGKP